jgi:hypothetical protein
MDGGNKIRFKFLIKKAPERFAVKVSDTTMMNKVV